MALSLAAVLEHPALQHSRPLLVAGDPATRTVRWVHSSEIYDIARLLRGGELLLTTGLGLEPCTPEQRRGYVRALTEKGIAGLALELSDSFAEVPAEMVDEARRLGLPFVVLREVYPFVEVTEQVNSAILDSSVGRLQHADEVGRALSRVLAERGGLDALTRTLARLLGRPVVLTDAAGAQLAAAADDAAAVLRAPGATAPVMADGILLGELAVGAGDSAPELLQAAVDRAPEMFALEILRSRQQPLLLGRDRRDLLTAMLTGAPTDPGVLETHAAASRVSPDARWAGLAVAAGSTGALAIAHEVARAADVPLLATEVDGTAYGLLALPAGDAAPVLDRVRSALRSAPGGRSALGPVAPAAAAGRSLRAARQALLLDGGPARDRPLLAEQLTVERLLAGVDDPVQLHDLVDEQLGPLLAAPRGDTLLHTLAAYLDSGCSKAATARALHLRRQSVHQRLARITALLGDLDDPRRQTALRLALAARELQG